VRAARRVGVFNSGRLNCRPSLAVRSATRRGQKRAPRPPLFCHDLSAAPRWIPSCAELHGTCTRTLACPCDSSRPICTSASAIYATACAQFSESIPGGSHGLHGWRRPVRTPDKIGMSRGRAVQPPRDEQNSRILHGRSLAYRLSVVNEGDPDPWRTQDPDSLIGAIFGDTKDYAERTVPLLVSLDLDEFSGAMFNGRGEAIEPSPVMTDSLHIRRFMQASEGLARKALESGPAKHGT
jgi:hypothetical protein